MHRRLAEECFQPEVQWHDGKEVLLMLDNYKAHENKEFLELAADNRVLVWWGPPLLITT